MKKIKPIVIVCTILLLIAAYFFLFKDSGLFSGETRIIAIQDTSQIVKILLIQPGKTNAVVEISKDSGIWLVNKKFPADKKRIIFLLSILKNLEFKASVPKDEIKSVIDSLSNFGVKVEVFSTKSKLKGFTIGGMSSERLGNYVLPNKTGKPIIVNIPGVDESLFSFFNDSEFKWRNKTILSYLPHQIKSISIVYTSDKSKSFFLKNNGIQNFEVTDAEKNGIRQLNKAAITRYLNYFIRLDYFKVVQFSANQIDSVNQQKPNEIIKITGIDSNLLVLQTFPVYKTNLNPDKKAVPDLDFLYVIINEDKNVLIVKYFDIDPILKELDYFRQ